MAETKQAKPNIVGVPTADDLARSAVDTFVHDAEKAIEQNGCFRVAISGGHSPEKFFQLLSQANLKLWDKVELFWVDERCVPPTDEQSNYLLAEKTFLHEVPIPAESVHRVPTETSDFNAAAMEYEQTIRTAFGVDQDTVPEFDLMILGMGPDGHIGSLFPNTYTAFETNRLVSVVYVMDDKLNRITMTYPVMQAAKHLMVLISGQSKADIVKEIFTGEPDEIKYPVHILWPTLDKIIWIIDQQASELL